MTPRHPPRALRGLTTPTRPPRRPRSPRAPAAGGTGPDARSKPPVCAAARGVVRRGGPPDSFDCGSTRPLPRQGGPTSPRAFVERLILPLPRRLSRSRCLRDRRPDCQRRDGGRRRSRPGSPPAGPSRPPPGRWPGGEAAARAAPPRTQRAAEARSTTERRIRRPPRESRGGRRPVTVAGEASGRVDGRVCEAGRTSVGSRRRPSGWRDGADVDLAPEGADRGVGVILRKEVIQPQVPLRLPCYDLVPITGFIFGACL